MRGYPTFWSAVTFFKWLFWRLPFAFSIPFTFLFVLWALHGFRYLHDLFPWTQFRILPDGKPVEPGLLRWLVPDFVTNASRYQIEFANLDRVIHALIVIVLFLAGFFLLYNLAVLINWLMVRFELKQLLWPSPFLDASPQVPPKGAPRNNPLAGINRIGIVLAGGGAKGAFQAGAMKAIYQFLAEHNALHKVKVISSTSVGSWNALFWLADLIMPESQARGAVERGKAPHADPKNASTSVDQRDESSNARWGGRGLHERWWRSISAKSLVAPCWYVPFFRNAFLSSLPWRQEFDQIFGQKAVKEHVGEAKIHFYMTRSNVRTGELECATNNPKPVKVNRIRYDVLNPKAPDFLDRIKTAVFASMDLPPLFPYIPWDDDLFEDGGVIDNLPISFAAREKCDLVFVLPLNADFEEEPNLRSLIVRLNRVLDVRQGTLERQGFKLLYLYNELAALRHNYEALERRSTPSEEASVETVTARDAKNGVKDSAAAGFSNLPPLERALKRRHKPLRVFAVCPQKSFAQDTINTRDLWNSAGASIAFKEMYKSTSRLLSDYDFKKEQKAVRVALVSRGGIVNWDENF
jgi:predicted acylesterase/phospholipase RssA